MDIDLEARLNNIISDEEATEPCPACGTLHPLQLIKSQFFASPAATSTTGRNITDFSSGILKTMVCFACENEWIPKITG